MTIKFFTDQASEILEKGMSLAGNIVNFQSHTSSVTMGPSAFIQGLTVFILAVFVGYYVVWRVTPALHSPLMGVTNAISSVIIVGALLAAGLEGFGFTEIMGAIAVTLASVNIFGGFIVTHRMLQMFSKKS